MFPVAPGCLATTREWNKEDLANNKPLALEHIPHSSRTFEIIQAWPVTVTPPDRNIRLQLLWGVGERFHQLVR